MTSLSSLFQFFFILCLILEAPEQPNCQNTEVTHCSDQTQVLIRVSSLPPAGDCSQCICCPQQPRDPAWVRACVRARVGRPVSSQVQQHQQLRLSDASAFAGSQINAAPAAATLHVCA